MAFRDLLALWFAPAQEKRLARMTAEATQLLEMLGDASEKLNMAVARQAKRDVREAKKKLDPPAELAHLDPARAHAPTAATVRAEWKAGILRRAGKTATVPTPRFESLASESPVEPSDSAESQGSA